MNNTLAASRLSVHQTVVKAGQCFPAYSLFTGERLNSFQWEMFSAVIGPSGYWTADNEWVSVREMYTHAFNDRLGSVVGGKKTIRGLKVPVLGFGVTGRMADGLPSFEMVPLSVAWMHSLRENANIEDSELPMPTWWAKHTHGSNVMLDVVSGHSIRVKQLRHLPWSMLPFDWLFNCTDNPRLIHRYQGGHNIWARRANVDVVYLGYANDVGDVHSMYQGVCYNKEPEKVLLGPTVDQATMLMEGSMYTPPRKADLSINFDPLLPEAHPMLTKKAAPQPPPKLVAPLPAMAAVLSEKEEVVGKLFAPSLKHADLEAWDTQEAGVA